MAGGVMGTMKLLLHLKQNSLPLLSPMLGRDIRTNSESLIGVTSYGRTDDFSEGIAIGSIVKIDNNRNIEPVKYGAGSGFWRLFMSPLTSGSYFLQRLFGIFKDLLVHPLNNLKVFFTDDFAKRTIILLYMESIDSTLSLVKSKFGFLTTKHTSGVKPTASNPIAFDLANKVAGIIGGKAMVIASESLLNIPTTAHILGGAVHGQQ